ncbi:hypothetical protein ALI144C_31825 [Actinosynnema sp. ALI-1.44]|uniref:acetoacetate decarboxylase family protein n=1 Tax=Actinosynnema sp. ALI-1.44 TaxID=1933779 RepID=UPI00097BD491|nr:acetoacetate decarboxylase family protein [Actinosynnema sp. ALI-1.44]ONI77986.1 hypothetical protein ALI144C_31825 [Actinosynnema sp. ALI-1.44]
MLSGTADPVAMAGSAPVVSAMATQPLECRGAELIQMIYEVGSAPRQAVLPPALHPVNPAAITVSVLTVGESDAGPFTLAETRIVCRSGVRSRGFHVSCFVSETDVGNLLADRWGFRVLPGEVELSRHYHGTTAVVRRDGVTVLDMRLLGPQVLSAGDLQFTDAMHLAHTPHGVRLIQVERTYEVAEVVRGRPLLTTFDAAAWGEPRLTPTHPISVVSLAGAVTFRPVRYICDPAVNAWEGTQRVG